MEKKEQSPGGKEGFIDIRKLAALDIIFHGPRKILLEFGLTVVTCGVLAALSISFYFRTPGQSPFPLILGLLLALLGCNYVPLLIYAIIIVRNKSALQEAAFELEHKDTSTRKYTLQSLLLFLPLFVLILAIVQEARKRSRPVSESE
jgi:hypothetical protein